MEKINQYLNEIAQVFGYNYNENFFSYLKTISRPNNQVCNKQITEGEGNWKCIDCRLDKAACICNDCYNKSKEKHRGHKVSFDPEGNGYCDCGDPNVVKKGSFCSDHNGPFTNENEIMNFIYGSISKHLLKQIEPILNNIFYLLIEKIDILFNKDLENKEDKIILEDEIYNMIDELISFLSNLYENNLGLFYYVSFKFNENFPFETNHKCFKFNERDNQIIFIKENYKEKHYCICPFFQVLIYVLMRKKTKHNSNSFFSLFIQNYKNKIITCISYLHSFLMLYDNSNLNIFRGLDYQLLNEELSELVHEENNIYFLENFYVEIYNKIKKLISLETYRMIEEILYKLTIIVKKLPKLKLINKIGNNIKIHNIIIDIICLLNNVNIFSKEKKTGVFSYGYLPELLDSEIFSLLIASLMSHLIDYSNLELIKSIFNKIISKIIDYKEYKENSSRKEYTPHISCIRCYTILLNRFCMYYSATNNCDLLDSFHFFQSIVPESKKLNLFLFKELISLFGFFISLKYFFFKEYGDKMFRYFTFYFSSNILINSDITLMKYLLAIPEVQNEFSLDKFLIYSNIDSCNNFFFKFKNGMIKDQREQLIKLIKNEKINLKYINSLLEFLMLIVRDNFSMLNLAFKYADEFRMNYNDWVLEKILEKEKNNFEVLIKNDIIHHILGNNNSNSIKKENFLKIYKTYEKYLNLEDLIEKVFHEDCQKKIINDIKFNALDRIRQIEKISFNKSSFPYCDIDYIKDILERDNAKEYIDINQLNILNTYIVEPLQIQKKFNKEVYNTFFKNTYLIEITFIYSHIINNKLLEMSDILFNNLSKIFYVYFKLEIETNNDEFLKALNKVISRNILDDKYKKGVLKEIKSLLLNNKKYKKLFKLKKYINY